MNLESGPRLGKVCLKTLLEATWLEEQAVIVEPGESQARTIFFAM